MLKTVSAETFETLVSNPVDNKFQECLHAQEQLTALGNTNQVFKL
jgi:hypothetical protein